MIEKESYSFELFRYLQITILTSSSMEAERNQLIKDSISLESYYHRNSFLLAFLY